VADHVVGDAAPQSVDHRARAIVGIDAGAAELEAGAEALQQRAQIELAGGVEAAATVTLCSLWPTLINTALGVASIDKDLVNVSKVLKMNTWTKITKLVLPSALPLIFTGLRLSLGVGWMVLIAAEMLAQNPGLGKFVWDEFQNGSSQSLAKIIVAVLTIGIIGFLLDRVMFALQSLFTFSANR
jgi:nitrate/nitrite transport system permease protein